MKENSMAFARLRTLSLHWNNKWCSLLVWLATSKLQMTLLQSKLTTLTEFMELVYPLFLLYEKLDAGDRHVQ
uniref:Uncharacterized protein LOC105120651 isoform X3 n=1 Tax=Rhizophora mucronata TaxID=61149 RepID=A0A2P2L022_RHIMU